MQKTTKKELKSAIKNLSYSNIPYKFNSFIASFVELQRILVGSFLILPKMCGDKLCDFNRNNYFQFNFYNNYNGYILYLNLVTLFMFLSLYFSELRREYLLVNYLYNDKSMANDNNNVGLVLTLLPINTQNKIYKVNRNYKIIGFITILFFILNTIGNSYILYLYYNYPSLLIFITNTLFMGTKILYVSKIISTEKNILYSAYINEKYQFNDIVPLALEKIQNNLDNQLQSTSIELRIN